MQVGLARSAARLLLVVTALAVAIVSERSAESAETAPRDLGAAVARGIDRAIVPAYGALRDEARTQVAAMERLCEMPSVDALTTARASFADLVRAFAVVEPYRFGPAREDNRFERLFFWPDSRGRGLRQVQTILTGEDETAIEVSRLREKSVAIQGLLALDYVLHGADSEALAEPGKGFRCRYGEAIAGAIAVTADELLDGWTDQAGFAALMRNPGPDNPIYRSQAEALQDLLQAGAEQVELVASLKLGRVLGETPSEARPRRAPFWRSGNALSAMAGNVDGVARLTEAIDLSMILPDGDTALAQSLAFELSQAKAALGAFEVDERSFAVLLDDPDAHGRLHYATLPLGGALDLLQTQIPAAFGLVAGFNSLDGD